MASKALIQYEVWSMHLLPTLLVFAATGAEPPQAPPPPQAPACRPTVAGYSSMRLLALETGKPLIVGVGCEPPKGPWLTVRWDGFPTEGKPCVIVSLPKGGGDLIWLATLPSTCQSSDIARILGTPVSGTTLPSGGAVVGVWTPGMVHAPPLAGSRSC